MPVRAFTDILGAGPLGGKIKLFLIFEIPTKNLKQLKILLQYDEFLMESLKLKQDAI